MNAGSGRAVPRPFKLHWGEGQIVELSSMQTVTCLYALRY